jgi:hypothetical protein
MLAGGARTLFKSYRRCERALRNILAGFSGDNRNRMYFLTAVIRTANADA